jgi:hypothetical protein
MMTEVFMLNVADYNSPECTCNAESMVAKLDHVDQLDNIRGQRPPAEGREAGVTWRRPKQWLM